MTPPLNLIALLLAIALGLLLRHAPHCRPFPTHQTYLEPQAEQCEARR